MRTVSFVRKRTRHKARPCSKRCENCRATRKQKPSVCEVVLDGEKRWLCVDCEAMLSMTQEAVK